MQTGWWKLVVLLSPSADATHSWRCADISATSGCGTVTLAEYVNCRGVGVYECWGEQQTRPRQSEPRRKGIRRKSKHTLLCGESWMGTSERQWIAWHWVNRLIHTHHNNRTLAFGMLVDNK